MKLTTVFAWIDIWLMRKVVKTAGLSIIATSSKKRRIEYEQRE